MRHTLTRLSCLATMAVAGCATITEGTGQSVAVSTAPSGATCSVIREGQAVGQVAATPGSIRIDKSKNDLTVTCSKPGYQTASISQSPEVRRNDLRRHYSRRWDRGNRRRIDRGEL
jgi:hypothetical protein